MGAVKFDGKRYTMKDRLRRSMGSIGPDGFRNHTIHTKFIENWLKKPALNAVIAGWSAGDVPYTIANRNFEVLGTNMTTALATFALGGGITLTTAGADNDQGIVTPHLDTAQSAWAVAGTWGSENSPRMEVLIKTAASVAAISIWAGFKLTNTPTVATDDDQVFLKFATTEGTTGASTSKWNVFTSRAGTDVVDVASNLPAVAASTFYRLVLEVDENRRPAAYIGVGLTAPMVAVPMINGQAPLTDAIDFIPYIGVAANGAAAAKAITVLPNFTCSRLAA